MTETLTPALSSALPASGVILPVSGLVSIVDLPFWSFEMAALAFSSSLGELP